MATRRRVQRAVSTSRHLVTGNLVTWPSVSSSTTPPAPATAPDVMPASSAISSATKDQAMADTIRALKECYPDRWEAVWAALGKASESDRAMDSLAKVAANDPRAAMGALVGGLVGAVLGRMPR